MELSPGDFRPPDWGHRREFGRGRPNVRFRDVRGTWHRVPSVRFSPLVVITVVIMGRLGLFGLDLGFATPLAMLAIHVVFGAFLRRLRDR
jgi:hypothetical protein